MKVLTVVGARPQFIKAAAVSRAIAEANRAGRDVDEVLVHTGQHYDETMSTIFFDELGIPAPRHHLGVGSSSHGAQTGEMLRRLEPVIVDERPDLVVVYGDTNSTLAGALVAAKLHVPVVHVEAGLRSFDRRMPEEVNRVVTDHLSDLLLCPSETAIVNLASEGITARSVFTGDVMHDVLLRTVAGLGGANPAASRLGLEGRPYVAATIHRASNTDEPTRAAAIFEAFAKLAGDGVAVVFPVHPRTRSLAEAARLPDGVHLVDPIGHADMVGLVRSALAVITDSGGLQKEAAWLGTPCVTARDETEWVETVDAGWNVVVGADSTRIFDAVRQARAPERPFLGYGAGDAAERVVDAIVDRVTT